LAGGDRFDYGGTRMTVMAPPPEDVTAESVTDQDSLVLRLVYGRRSVLLTGDLEPKVEASLVEAGAFSPTDILKVPHHGSRASTSNAMLKQVRPTFAVISDGFENTYHHPHPQLLGRLEAARATPLRTDLLGLVTLYTDGRTLEVEQILPHFF